MVFNNKPRECLRERRECVLPRAGYFFPPLLTDKLRDQAAKISKKSNY